MSGQVSKNLRARRPFQTISNVDNAFNAQGFGVVMTTVPADRRLVYVDLQASPSIRQFVIAICGGIGAN